MYVYLYHKKITNTEFRSFLEKYFLNDIQNKSAVRKTHVDDCYDETILENV